MNRTDMQTQPLSRRHFLTASGVAIGLPFLESLQTAQAGYPQKSKKRFVAINVGLGLHAPNITPKTTGKNYQLTPYLKVLEEYRDQFTYISGASHPSVGGGHFSSKSFLTAAKHPNSAGFKNSISLDQFVAERLGTETRFASLSLTTSSSGLSWSRSGVEIPAESRPSRLFQKLFVEGKPDEKAKQIDRLRKGQSVLDAVAQRAKMMQQRISGADRAKLDQYFNSVREAEIRMQKAEAWAAKPKPIVENKPPRDILDRTQIIERLDLLYDMMHLAIQTDSTRFLTLFDTGQNLVPDIAGVDTDHHMLSHHAKDESKIEQLTIVEMQVMKSFGRFLNKLNDSSEGEATLLDQTMILFGSNLGNASSHDSKNMPIILAGGDFMHGQHLAFDQHNNYPLPNLFVNILQKLDLEVDDFASSTGTMTGLI